MSKLEPIIDPLQLFNNCDTVEGIAFAISRVKIESPLRIRIPNHYVVLTRQITEVAPELDAVTNG